MSAARAEQLVSRNWPDVLDRRQAAPLVDIDPTVPCRRKTDRRDEEVIRPASDLRPQANALELQKFKALDRRFTAEPISNFGTLA